MTWLVFAAWTAFWFRSTMALCDGRGWGAGRHGALVAMTVLVAAVACGLFIGIAEAFGGVVGGGLVGYLWSWKRWGRPVGRPLADELAADAAAARAARSRIADADTFRR